MDLLQVVATASLRTLIIFYTACEVILCLTSSNHFKHIIYLIQQYTYKIIYHKNKIHGQIMLQDWLHLKISTHLTKISKNFLNFLKSQTTEQTAAATHCHCLQYYRPTLMILCQVTYKIYVITPMAHMSVARHSGS